MKLTLESLLRDALEENHLLEAADRDAVVATMARTVTERVLADLIEAADSRALGEQLQEAMLRGSDLLEVARQEGFVAQDAFGEAFGSALAKVLDELVEVSEEDDASNLRRRLHAAVLTRMQEEIEREA